MGPSRSELKRKIQELVPTVDLQTTGIKQFTKLLSEEFDADLKAEKDFIRKAVTEAIEEHNKRNNSDSEQEEEDEEDDDDEVEEDEDDEPPTRQKKRGAATGKGGSGNGLTAKKEISPKLAAFLKQGNTMSRTEVVKSLWEYIREHNLQNPNNKREIILDEAMKKVFGCKTFTMFTMNKYVGAHIHPFKPVDLTTNTTKPKKRKADPKEKGKKKRKAGSQPPFRLSAELQAVVQEEILPRPQVVSKLWVYIKANELQNEANKREIICDDKLKAVFKKSKVTMFEIGSLITRHLVEKVDKSEYHHKDESNQKVEDDSDEEEEEEDEEEEESD